MSRIVICLVFLSLSLTVYCSNIVRPFQDRRLVEFNETHRSWMTPDQIDKLVAECGAAAHGGFIDITDHMTLQPNEFTTTIPRAFPDPSRQTYVRRLFAGIEKNSILGNNNGLSAFHTRYYTTETGFQAAQYIFQKFNEYGNGRDDVSVSFFTHSWRQPSVVARIAGSVRPEQTIVIGAHEDSINGGATGRAPGADDDASGTATVLETFRVLMLSGYVPEISVEFHTYAAEEVGLRGSQDIAANYQKNKKSIYAMLQMDMTMYKGRSNKIAIITDYTDTSLNSFVRKIVDTYANLQWQNDVCGYGCSDHASWTKAGYAASFPFESGFRESNPRIHTSSDLIDILDLDQAVEFVKISLGFIVELAGVANSKQ